MTKTLTYLLLVFSTFCFAQNKSQKDSLGHSYSILTSARFYSNKALGFTSAEYKHFAEQDILLPPPEYYANYPIDLRHLYFELDSTFIEVVQNPVIINLNPTDDFYAFKDTCDLKYGLVFRRGRFSVLNDTIYLTYLNLTIYDNIAYSDYELFRSMSSNNRPLSKLYLSQFEICQFDYEKRIKFLLKSSELFDMTGKKWFGSK